MENQSLNQLKLQIRRDATHGALNVHTREQVLDQRLAPLAEAFGYWRASLCSSSSSYPSAERSRLDRLIAHLGHLPLRDIHPDLLRKLPRARAQSGDNPKAPLRPATVQKLQKLLRQVFKHINESLLPPALRGCLKSHPALCADLMAGARFARSTRLPRSVVDGICAHVVRRDHQLFIRLLVETGLRLNELLGVRWCDVSLSTEQLRVVDRTQSPRGKVRERVMNLTQEAVTIIGEMRSLVGLLAVSTQERVFRFGQRGVQQAFANAKQRAGHPEVTLHDARRECVSRMAEKGAPMETLAGVTGHRDLTTLKRHYLRPAPEVIADRIPALAAARAANDQLMANLNALRRAA